MKASLFCATILFIHLSCEKSVNPPSDNFVEFDYSQIHIGMAYYDSIEVVTRPTKEVKTRLFNRFQIGTKRAGSFESLSQQDGNYDEQTKSYAFTFNHRFRIDPALLSFPLTVRFHLLDKSTKEIDTLINALSYPFQSTEPVLFWNARRYVFEDVEVYEGRIFLQPGSTLQWVYQYDFFVNEPRDSIFLGVYEVIAFDDSSNVYFDHVDCSLVKYNLNTRVFTYIVPRSSICNTGLLTFGLEVYQGNLYELFGEPTGISLKRWDLSGHLLDSTKIYKSLNRLTIHNGVAYFQTLTIDGPRIARLDLATKSFLPNLKSPTMNGEGIRIRDGYFYFLDYGKKLVARVRLDEFINTP